MSIGLRTTAALNAIIKGEEESARVVVNSLTPADRARLAAAAKRLHEICTQTAENRETARAVVLVQSSIGTGSSKPFLAKYEGTCGVCSDEIVAEADEIVMTDNGAVHVDCAP